MRQPSLRETIAIAHRLHFEDATRALVLFRSFVSEKLGGVPGIATLDRLAVRCLNGRSPEEAAAAEYLYRWRLALQSPVFGVPHPLGL